MSFLLESRTVLYLGKASIKFRWLFILTSDRIIWSIRDSALMKNFRLESVQSVMNKRIEWIDAAKWLGMFFIYLGHFGMEAGLVYPWVFSFHVPLFFFLSGCLENYNKRGILSNAWHKFVNIVIPFFFFGILDILYDAIEANTGANIGIHLMDLVKGGVRGQLKLAGGLWFLTCLFVIEIAFSLIRKLKWKPLILTVCLGLYFASELVMDPRPIMEPRFYWNLDSACYYMIYYCIGWLIYEPVNRMMSSESKKIKCLRTIGLVVCAFFSAKQFFGRNLLNEWTGTYPVCAEINSIINAMFSILLVIAVSNYLSHNEFIRKMGKNSLYLCGNEYLIKLLVPMVFSMIGITVVPTSPVQFGIYTFVLLLAANFVLVPLERPVLKKIQSKLNRLTSDTKVNIC